MCLEVARAKPDVIATWCTNLPAAPLVAKIEQATGLPMVDSTSLALFDALRRLTIDTRPAAAWGSIFADPPA
jgi:maleate isomerase